MHGFKTGLLGLFLVLVSTANGFGQLGIWTSQDREVLSGSASVPTTLGAAHGFTTQIGTFSAIQTAPVNDFGTFNANANSYAQVSYFTPDSLVLWYSRAAFSTSGGGINQTNGTNFKHHIEANFHLSDPTEYTLGTVVSPGANFAAAGNYPVLNGPGGQTITLDHFGSGMLAAGDWHFLYEYQSVYSNDTSAVVLSERNSKFAFVVPEPTSLGVLVVSLSLLLCRRLQRAVIK